MDRGASAEKASKGFIRVCRPTSWKKATGSNGVAKEKKRGDGKGKKGPAASAEGPLPLMSTKRCLREN